MNAFEWIDARSVDEAVRLLSSGSDQVVAKAGGVDLIDLMKEGLVRPNRVVNLRTIGGLSDIRFDEQGLHLGALVTLAQIASDARVQRNFAALAAAADHAATPQVRNVATIGGNVLQRPRCWYFRSAHFERDQVAAAARDGANQYHGIFATEQSPLVHASTPATALLAYDATIHLASSRGTRSVAIRDFFLAPDPVRASDVAMSPGEVLTHITLPALPKATVAAYLKQTERDSYDWPICDVAVVLKLASDRTVETAAIALGWVAPTPMRASDAEAELIGRKVDDATAHRASLAALRGAKPLSSNAYKLRVLETALHRTLLQAVE